MSRKFNKSKVNQISEEKSFTKNSKSKIQQLKKTFICYDESYYVHQGCQS